VSRDDVGAEGGDSEVVVHHHLVDVVAVDAVVVLPDGFDLPALPFEERDGLLVRRRRTGWSIESSCSLGV